MKTRIGSIMDTGKKRAGLGILSAAMLLTLGTGYAFAASRKTDPPEILHEVIRLSPSHIVFSPDPALYAPYAPYGIEISQDGGKLLYNGKALRLFVDEGAESEAFYFDESGEGNLRAVRNGAGEIIGLRDLTVQEGEAYYEAFFAEELESMQAVTSLDDDGATKYDQYQPFGVTYDGEKELLLYRGERVKFFVDEYPGGWPGAFWTDESGTALLKVKRDESGAIQGVEAIPEKTAQAYLDEAEEQGQYKYDGLETKVVDKAN